MHGGMEINFANNAKLFELEINWRNLQPHQLYACPSPEQVTQWINDGKIRLRASMGRMPGKIRKLTITQAKFLYDGNLGSEPMNFVYPIADFFATVEGENVTNNTVFFLAPMTMAKENWQILNGKN